MSGGVFTSRIYGLSKKTRRLPASFACSQAHLASPPMPNTTIASASSIRTWSENTNGRSPTTRQPSATELAMVRCGGASPRRYMPTFTLTATAAASRFPVSSRNEHLINSTRHDALVSRVIDQLNDPLWFHSEAPRVSLDLNNERRPTTYQRLPSSDQSVVLRSL